VDVDSVAREALWKAILAGAELTRAYLFVRIEGAVRDEMRTLMAGTRRAPIAPSSFLEMSDALGLTAESDDLDAQIDRSALLERMPAENRFLVEELAAGRGVSRIAADCRVSEPAVSQVMARLCARPTARVKVPGRIDFYAEAARILREETARHAGRATSYREVTSKLGPSGWGWATGSVARVNLRATSFVPSPVRDAARKRILRLVEEAFRRNGGRFPEASVALSVSPMTAYRWSKLLPRDAITDRGKHRPDLSDHRFIELRAQGFSINRIAQHLGVAACTVKYRFRRAKGLAARAAPVAEAAE
jgi:transposase